MSIMYEFLVDVSLFEAGFIVYFEGCFRILIVSLVKFLRMTVAIHVIIVDDKSIKQIFLIVQNNVPLNYKSARHIYNSLISLLSVNVYI